MNADLAAIVALQELRIGVEMDSAYDPKSSEKLAALDAAIAALHSQAQEREGWRPIETAPRDGSLFLCWVDAVRYGERDDGSVDTADCSDVDFCQWCDSEHGGYYMNMMGDIGDGQNITHWMPLPAAPTGGSET